MRSQRRGAAGAAALMLIGASNLAAGVRSVNIADTACMPQVPLIAPFGVHLDLLVESELCPEHSYLPGLNFGRFAQSFVVLSATTLIAGLVSLLLRARRGIARQAARRPRLARTRLSDARPATSRTCPRCIMALVVAAPGRRPYHPLQRRGPPPCPADRLNSHPVHRRAPFR